MLFKSFSTLFSFGITSGRCFVFFCPRHPLVPHQVTSPDDCPGEEPYIPEGFKDDITQKAGAARKECYDGYRCEAWWGSLDGQPRGDPILLNAPMDWPDCCELCSNIDADGVGTETCAGWSFHPNTGSCQLLANVAPDGSVSTSWGVSGTIHGYPGYFEPPANGCWFRAGSGLCENMLFYLLVASAGCAFVGLLYVWWAVIHIPSKKSRLLGELLRDRQLSRLKKATCVEVSITQLRASKGKGESSWVNTFEGTFVTQDNALFVVPQMTEGEVVPPLSRTIEQDVLCVLFAEGLDLLADGGVAARCRTTQGLKKEFNHLLVKARRTVKKPLTSTTRRPQQNEHSPSFDCLLLVGGENSDRQKHAERKVSRYSGLVELAKSWWVLKVGGREEAWGPVFWRHRRVLQASLDNMQDVSYVWLSGDGDTAVRQTSVPCILGARILPKPLLC